MKIGTTWESPVIEIPDNDTLALDFALTRKTSQTPTRWIDPDCYVEVLYYVSVDQGRSWTVAGGWGAWGGQHIRRDGTEGTHSQAPSVLPKGIGRLAKCVIVATKPFEAELYAMGLTRRPNGSTNIRQLSVYQ